MIEAVLGGAVQSGLIGKNVGWKVKVHFTTLLNKVRTKDHMDVLRTVLSTRYSLLQSNGNGIQSVYLTELLPSFAEVLTGLIGEEARLLISAMEVVPVTKSGQIITGDDLDVWEHRLEDRVAADASIRETDREAIIRARRGQGPFKQRVMLIEKRCRTTGVDNPIHLLASHCKPWRDSSNDERLDGK